MDISAPGLPRCSNPSRGAVKFCDKLIAALITALAALPFSQLFVLKFGFTSFDAYQTLYGLISLLLVGRIFLFIRLKYPGPFLVFSGIAAFFTALSLLQFGTPVSDSIRHLRIFAPFFVATLLLAAGFTIPVNAFLRLMVGAAFVSSASALYIHYFAPEFLEIALAQNEDVYILATRYGRVYWTNGATAFFSVLALFAPNLRLPRVLVASVVILSMAAIFATSSRTTLIGGLLFLAGALILSDTFSTVLKRVRIVLIILCSLLAAMFALAEADAKIAALVQQRIFGEGNVRVVYEEAFIESRYELYETYIGLLKNSFPLGLGLGRPYIYKLDGTAVFTTDISFMSFILPFGILGLGGFLYFVWKLAAIMRSVESSQVKKLIAVMYGTFLVMALNADFFSRENFVLFFSALVLALEASNNRQQAI